MKGLSIVVTLLLLIFAGQLASWLHRKGASPEQLQRSSASAAWPVKTMLRHLQPPVRL